LDLVIVQLVGLAVDGLWHGLLHPGFEPQTFGEMVRHLLTVHLLLYIGVVGLFVCTTWALLGLSVNRDFRMGCSSPPGESLLLNCLPGGEA
jgi:hypothetical protein